MTRRNFMGSVAASAACAAQPPTASGGNGTFFIGGRPNVILVFDEASEKAVGQIRLRTGTPANMRLSTDHKRIYATTSTLEDLEIIDVPSRQVVDAFRLTDGRKQVRIRGFEPDPGHHFLILLTKAATKQPDRWEIGPNTLLQYDLKDHRVMRTIPWPKGEEREFAGVKFSPDGKYLYLFGEDILVFDTTDFKEVDKWELSRPIEDGFGRINLNSLDDTYEEPGFSTGIFHVQDAVQNRRIMGIARVNLGKKEVNFYALGPATGVSFAMAPNRQWAYGLLQEVGRYEFWTFDLKNRRVHSRTEFDGRPRMLLTPSTNGRLLYIYQAGNTIDYYDAATYKYLRTVSLDMDMTRMVVVPPPA